MFFLISEKNTDLIQVSFERFQVVKLEDTLIAQTFEEPPPPLLAT